MVPPSTASSSETSPASRIVPPPFPWQARLWEACLHLQQADRIHHAFLLRGVAGNGKRAFAMRWANAIVCEGSHPEGRPCGLCRGCILFAARTHPDIKMVEPLSDKKSIGIDQIREVIDYVWLSRQFASRKPVIMPEAERMTISAANTLLKTLEEPPGNAVFILISNQSDRLPITIRSRCRFLDFSIPPRDSVLPWLLDRLPHGTDAGLLLNAAGGSPLLALHYGEGDTLQQRMTLHRDLIMLLTGKTDPLIIAARWKTLGCTVVLPWIAAYLMDLIRLRFTGELQSAIHPDDGDAMRRFAENLDVYYGYRLLDRCLSAKRAWEDSPSLNEALLLEGIAIDFAIHDSQSF
uniref:DNA polymerase III subunit delta' n=1 Tax=Candidatus Kentrum sp. SD TaxID=2126332 RepID=A0A450Y6P9_9GAMM|nr:MAG: DNA polymerase-3 subunit delta' [Candidatus Kentron sp. SD]VFK41529.1 MAG: DNA polymerase-3 subunit delta' [Candidatus Kentron sp. SD]VFK78510.1 MAG: DNA polymerase-3 subunit delta' [Candidatus Kentron sp. SD]